jgi:hypothetical protein
MTLIENWMLRFLVFQGYVRNEETTKLVRTEVEVHAIIPKLHDTKKPSPQSVISLVSAHTLYTKDVPAVERQRH